METPDKYLIVKIEDYYKVFATYLGGYLNGDSWRINSGIKSVTEDESFYYFHGHSGSTYKCHKKSYGANYYTQSVLDDMINKAKERGVAITIMPEDTDFINLEIKETE